jgi:hypothetical protein
VHAQAAQIAASVPSDRLLAGDLVFRLGRSFGSQAVISVDPMSSYSHVGILAAGEDTNWYVIHVMPQAVTDANPVRLQPLSEFISTDQAAAFAFYRFEGSDREHVRAVAVANARTYYANGVVFDSQFDLSTDNAMYCTELVWKAYLAAGVDLLDGRLDALEGPFFSGLYVLPSTLQKSSVLASVD